MADNYAKIWNSLSAPAQRLLERCGNLRETESYSVKMFHRMREAGLITDSFPERLTPLGERVLEYGKRQKRKAGKDG